jgi:hypothetical protein
MSRPDSSPGRIPPSLWFPGVSPPSHDVRHSVVVVMAMNSGRVTSDYYVRESVLRRAGITETVHFCSTSQALAGDFQVYSELSYITPMYVLWTVFNHMSTQYSNVILECDIQKCKYWNMIFESATIGM